MTLKEAERADPRLSWGREGPPRAPRCTGLCLWAGGRVISTHCNLILVSKTPPSEFFAGSKILVSGWCSQSANKVGTVTRKRREGKQACAHPALCTRLNLRRISHLLPVRFSLQSVAIRCF